MPIVILRLFISFTLVLIFCLMFDQVLSSGFRDTILSSLHSHISCIFTLRHRHVGLVRYNEGIFPMQILKIKFTSIMMDETLMLWIVTNFQSDYRWQRSMPNGFTAIFKEVGTPAMLTWPMSNVQSSYYITAVM